MLSQRIRQARLMAGLSQEELAARLTELNHPITKQAISKYENGDMMPKPTTILKLVQALNVDTEYLLQTPSLHVDWLAFRRRDNLAEAQQQQIKSFAEYRAEQQFELQRLLRPSENPRFPSQQLVTTVEQAEDAAENLRQAWHLDDHPIENLLGTIEDHGGVVIEWNEDTPDFDALVGLGNKITPIIIINTNVSRDRLRLNLAHELGHLCMDTSDIAEEEQEKLALRFAVAFLVPASVARRELSPQRQHIDWREIGILKQKYGMSMAAWLKRANELDIITDYLYKAMRKERADNHWWRSEPAEYDYEGLEAISHFKQMVLHAAAEHFISVEDARRLCPDCFDPLPLDTTPYPNARDLLKLPSEERNLRVIEAMRRSQNDDDIEIFDAYSEEDLDDDFAGA